MAARLSGLEAAGIGGHQALIRSLARLTQPAEDFQPTASLTVSGAGVGVELDTRGSIDVTAERTRLDKDLRCPQGGRGRTRKLANEAFLAKAPEPVVAKIRGRLAAAEAEIARLTAALESLTAHG